MVDKVLSENPKQLEQYRAGKTKLQGFFTGQVCVIYKKITFRLLVWSYWYLIVGTHPNENSDHMQVMKLSKGKANPGLLNKIFLEKLNAKAESFVGR